MPNYRAIVRLPWTSGLATDASVNVFHFEADALTNLASITTALVAFYNAVDSLMSSLISETTNACTIHYYDLADAEPRVPVRLDTFTVDVATTTNAPEIAACISFQGARLSGEPQSRRRGRVFLGPMAGGFPSTSTGRPTSTDRNTLATAAGGLLDASQATTEWNWCVYSPTDDAMVVVTDGWVDDEVDILRSRGRKPTARTTFS